MYDEQVPVLIVGAGPVGLCTAVFLARHGIKPLLVEKRESTSRLPRAPGLQARTMELFRVAGLQQDIRALEIGDTRLDFEGGILRVKTFSEIDDAVMLGRPTLGGPTISPEQVMACGQDRYERVLLRKAKEYGAQAWFNTRLVSFAQDDDGVSATTEDVVTGRQRAVRTRYLVGADGPHSRIRDMLGIERSGAGSAYHALSIYFCAPELSTLLKGRRFIACFATKGGLVGLSRVHGCDPWLAALHYYPDQGESPADFTDERCIEIIRTAAGKADLEVGITDKVPWECSQLVADRFRSGRVFLAGDAVHVHSPAGGFGVNTGIHDAHNLAWKIAAVLAGWGGDALLDTYDTERRPVGYAMAEQAIVRHRLWISRGSGSGEKSATMVNELVATMGYRYLSSAIIGAESHQVLTPSLKLTGEPGTRAPHVWLENDGELISTIDLFWDSFVLLIGPDGGTWADAATELASRTRVPLRVQQISGPEGLVCVDRDWLTAYGIQSDGAVLIRPDAFVAWRSTDLDPKLDHGALLAQVLDCATGRTREPSMT